jgi:hypothetical protein
MHYDFHHRHALFRNGQVCSTQKQSAVNPPFYPKWKFETLNLYIFVPDLREKLILSDCDMKLTGQVTWVGKTSMEVTMNLLQEQKKRKWFQLLTAKFLMVARDQNKK